MTNEEFTRWQINLMKKRKKNQIILIICIIVPVITYLFWNSSQRQPASNIYETEEVSAEQKLKSQFSSWDGSHRKLEAYIKEHMNDPDSYEHVETKYWETKGGLIVQTKFRGTNAFGAIVTQTVKAVVDEDGGIVNVFDE
jgi:hypothetical protein